MEKTAFCLCRIRDLQTEIRNFEEEFHERFDLSLNEGMILCTLSETETLTCGALSDRLDLTPSHTSKILGHLEDRGLIVRTMGETDRRLMFFSLTTAGADCIREIRETSCPTGGYLSGLMNL